MDSYHPGAWFWIGASAYLAYGFGVRTLDELAKSWVAVTQTIGEGAVCVFGFVVYVTGAALRILRPDTPDRISNLYSKWTDPESRIRPFDPFPYESLPDYLSYRGLHRLVDIVPWSPNGHYSGVPRSKTFLHYVKLLIHNKNSALSTHLARQEAFIRMLAGVFWATLLNSIVFGWACIAQGFCFSELRVASIAVLAISWFVVLAILRAFHYQRLRELVNILSALLIVDGLDPDPYVANKARRRLRPKR